MKPDMNIVGKKVYATSEGYHFTDPDFYPEVGTIGTVVDTSDMVLVEWPVGSVDVSPSGSTSWYCEYSHIELVEEDNDEAE